MTDKPSAVKSTWTVCITMVAAVAVFAILWAAVLLILYPSRIGSMDALIVALALDIKPACVHALALLAAALVAKKTWSRVGLAAVIGAGIFLVPWAIQVSKAGLESGIQFSTLAGIASAAAARAVATAALPFGDVLAGGAGGAKRVVALVLAVAGGLAAVSFIDAGFRFPVPAWGLAMLREAPFVWAWMNVPPPEKEEKKA